jgi:membrane associated rhomboid family serine protease
MLFKAAFALRAIWLLGRLLDMVGVYRVGDLAHVFVLVGGMLLLLAVRKTRDAALRPPRPPTED